MAVKKVIIVGAGMSGITCGRVLSELLGDDVEIEILEGAETIGGRTKTITTDNGTKLDLGASWIHGSEGNPMMEMAVRYGCALSQPSKDGDVFEYTFDDEGVKVDSEIDDYVSRELEIFFEKISASCRSMDVDITMEEAVHSHGLSTIIEKIQGKFEHHPYCRGRSHDRLLRNLCMTKLNHFEGYEGAMLKQISAKNHHLYELFPGEDRYVLGGYDVIIRGQRDDMLSRCRSSVSTEHVVQCVKKMESGGMMVSGKFREDSFEKMADVVVVTVSLGVLRAGNLKFEPPLSPAKTKVIQNRGYGLINKVFLEFSEAFWQPSGCWISLSTDDRRSSVTFCNLNFYGYLQPVLCAFYNQDNARMIEREETDVTVRRALDILSLHWGDRAKTTFLRATPTAWESDVFARGSYSFTATHDVAEDIAELAKPPEYGLFFAGEATEAHHFSTAHGALMSGERVARMVRDYMK